MAEQDSNNLNLLSIFHYVLGVFTLITLNKEPVKEIFIHHTSPLSASSTYSSKSPG